MNSAKRVLPKDFVVPDGIKNPRIEPIDFIEFKRAELKTALENLAPNQQVIIHTSLSNIHSFGWGGKLSIIMCDINSQ